MEARRDPDVKRAAILLAVLRVIATRGIDAVSIRTVAAQAGVSTGRVQHYFDSKQELLRATTAFMISAAEDRHAEQARPAPRDEVWALLTHAIPLAADSPAGTSVFYSLVAASVADPEIAATLAQAKAGVEELLTRLLVQLGVAAADAPAAARGLLALSDGLTLQVLIGHLTADDAHASLRTALRTWVADGERAAATP